ncbi:uncharacterized protein LOC133529335 [Cydia pomonella]|uniref:uncharacterized protein LOC133529335 n=1 Tax=Cydia pomonella TaxID=82600 RepID=UPI002ADD574B|nr:uncharacterized protein LOC133529335 [Cydia pomonella]
MSNVSYDLDTSGGLMPLIKALIKPPDEEVNNQKSKKPQHPYYKRPGKGHNRDSCDACGEGGDLICCDRCPASFHLGCYDPPLDENDIPAGLWLCRECQGADAEQPPSARGSRAVSPADSKDSDKKTRSLRNRSNSTKKTEEDDKDKDKDTKEKEKEDKELTPMEILVKAAKVMNPRQFELPREMRVPCPFPGTEKGKTRTDRAEREKIADSDDPREGSQSDEPAPVRVAQGDASALSLPWDCRASSSCPGRCECLVPSLGLKKVRQGRVELRERKQPTLMILVKAAKVMNPRQFELPREMRVPCPFPGTEKENGNSNGKNGNGLVTVDAWGCVPLPAKSCFVCRGTCKMAPLLACDYCPLLFHQDCLDPPLTALPTGRWMCPNHVEQYIDWKLVNSVSASERVALWERFAAPPDQHAIKLDFIRRARATRPPFRVKVPVGVRGRVVVPGMVRQHYAEPPPLQPSRREYVRCRNVLKNLQATSDYEASDEDEDAPKHTICLNLSCSKHNAGPQPRPADLKGASEEDAADDLKAITQPKHNAGPQPRPADLKGASEEDAADDLKAITQPKQAQRGAPTAARGPQGGNLNLSCSKHNAGPQPRPADLKGASEEDAADDLKAITQPKEEAASSESDESESDVEYDYPVKRRRAAPGGADALRAAVDDQLKKLDQNLVKLLAWQRLQQILVGEQCHGPWARLPLSAEAEARVQAAVPRARLARHGFQHVALPSELLSRAERERIARAVWGAAPPPRVLEAPEGPAEAVLKAAACPVLRPSRLRRALSYDRAGEHGFQHVALPSELLSRAERERIARAVWGAAPPPRVLEAPEGPAEAVLKAAHVALPSELLSRAERERIARAVWGAAPPPRVLEAPEGPAEAVLKAAACPHVALPSELLSRAERERIARAVWGAAPPPQVVEAPEGPAEAVLKAAACPHVALPSELLSRAERERIARAVWGAAPPPQVVEAPEGPAEAVLKAAACPHVALPSELLSRAERERIARAVWGAAPPPQVVEAPEGPAEAVLKAAACPHVALPSELLSRAERERIARAVWGAAPPPQVVEAPEGPAEAVLKAAACPHVALPSELLSRAERERIARAVWGAAPPPRVLEAPEGPAEAVLKAAHVALPSELLSRAERERIARAVWGAAPPPRVLEAPEGPAEAVLKAAHVALPSELLSRAERERIARAVWGAAPPPRVLEAPEGPAEAVLKAAHVALPSELLSRAERERIARAVWGAAPPPRVVEAPEGPAEAVLKAAACPVLRPSRLRRALYYDRAGKHGFQHVALPSELLSRAERERIARAVWGAAPPPQVVEAPEGPAEAVLKAAACPVLRPSRSGLGDGLGRPIPMRLSRLTFGADSSCDVVLDPTQCRYVSRLHAIIFYDEVTRHFELINYSEWGSRVDGVLYAMDVSEREAPVVDDEGEARAKAVRDVVRHRMQSGTARVAGAAPPPCRCGAPRGGGAAWEGSALVAHGALLQLGCLMYVFSVAQPRPDSYETDNDHPAI